jgi:aryl-alcohol dehydrogenase
MRTSAAVVREPAGDFVIEELDLDEPRDDEVLVRIVATGICHTDLAARDQHLPVLLPAVLGHEGAGVVEAVGARVSAVRPGDHVVLTWTCCGTCRACRSGQYSSCERFFAFNIANGTRPDGTATLWSDGRVVHGHFFGQSSFALHAIAGERSVVRVRDDVPLDLLAPLGCGVQTGAGAVMNTLRPRPGASIAVFGAGTVGLSAVLAALVCGCTTVVAVDTNPARLALATELGATHVVDASRDDPVEAVRCITDGGPDFSLECVGKPAVFRQAVDVLPRRGVCGLLGAVAPGTEVTLDMDLIMNARTVRGIIEGDAVPDLLIPRLVDLYAAGRFPYTRLIKPYPFKAIDDAVADMEAGRVVKPVLRMEQ